MCLRNKAFQSQTNAENLRKLDVVLRSLTNNRLTARQRRLIAYAIGGRRQYSFRLCQRPDALPNTTDTAAGQTVIRRIFGTVNGGDNQPAAVLIRHPGQDGTASTVYIYLPEEKEEYGDDTREEETTAQ